MLEGLHEGFKRFTHTHYRPVSSRCVRTHFQDIVENGQHPVAFVHHCADARSNATLLFGTQPGELFTNATIGALLPPESRVVRVARHVHPVLGSLAARFNPLSRTPHTWAAIQYAIHGLDVPNLVVLGHTGCGGLRALVNGTASGYISHWVDSARPLLRLARELYQPRNKDDLYAAVERANVVWGVRNLTTHLNQTKPANPPVVHGLLFDMRAGKLLRLTDRKLGLFQALS